MVHETIYYLPLLAKTSIVQSIVYGVLMSFVLNKHITIFTDNDMYHANFATLGNRSPILNEHIILIMEFFHPNKQLPDCPARSPFYVLSYTICCSFPQIYDFTINQCKILTLCSHSFCMRHQLSLMIQQIYLLNHHCQTSYHTKLFYQTVLFSY